MAKTIAINGIKLDEVRMLMEPYSNNTVAYLSYPKSQFRISQEGQTLRLAIPAYLAMELYRSGLLPTDIDTAVAISIGGRAAGWFKVSDVRCPHHSDGPFPQVNFTLTQVIQGHVHPAVDVPTPRKSTAPAPHTYVTDITHYLDEAGELMPLPGPARKLASFLTLVIETATSFASAEEHDSRVRCRTKSCRGNIRTVLPHYGDEILWYCPVCGHNGVISNWQNTKWNERKPTEEHE